MTSAPLRFLAAPLTRFGARVRMREREVRDTLWLLLAIAWVLAPHLADLPYWAGAGIVALVAWRAWVTWTGRRLPHRLGLIVLMSIAGVAVYLQYHTIFGKDAGVAYLVLLLGLKLLEMRARRDIFIVIFLCLFVMLTSFFESQTIASAVAMMVGLLLLIAALVSANFVGREPDRSIKVKLAGQLCLTALPLAAALFVLFPRVQGPLWGMPADAESRRTGLSESMSFGAISNLTESAELAFRVQFSGPLPPPAARYWRGPVFGSYNGSTWRPSPRWHAGPGAAQPELKVERSSVVDYTVTLEAQNRPWLFMLDAPVAAPKIAGTQTAILADLQPVAYRLVRERVRYPASSALRYRFGLNEDPVVLQQMLELPRGLNPRTRAFAAQLRDETSSAAGAGSVERRLIARLLQFIRTENFVYTLQPPALGANGIDQFLFDTRRGFCEHYASAFVVLMRMLEVPARVVTGYQGGEINPVDGVMEVRQRDAHAWAEVWIADEGWVRVDPTAAVAPERVERGFSQTFGQTQGLVGSLFGAGGNWLGTLTRQLRFNWDALDNAWNQWVLGYGVDAQSSLLSGFGIDRIDWQALTIALIVVFGVLLAIVGGQVLLARDRPDPVMRLYTQLCDRTAALAAGTGDGVKERTSRQRLPHEGPLDYFARIRAALPQHLQARAEEAFRLYEEIRYGRAAASTLLTQRLKTSVAGLRL